MVLVKLHLTNVDLDFGLLFMLTLSWKIYSNCLDGKGMKG